MNERQVQGTGLVVLSLLAALVTAGLFWNSLLPVADGGPSNPPAGSSTQAASRELWIPAGWRAEQVAAVLDEASIASGERFLELVRDPELAKSVLGPRWGDVPSLEGYLYPSTYMVSSGVSERALVAQMVSRFQDRFTTAMRRRADELGLTPHQVVTLASIVERESSLYSESPVIAGVFLNRLRAGIPLEADPTVVYAIDSEDTEGSATALFWERDLSATDLDLPSPYNSYLNAGLPPGPIASPSLQAIMAVLYPADVDYLFFVAKGDGAHAFSRTAEEHQRNVDRYRGAPGAPGGGRADGGSPVLQRLVEEVMQPLEGHVAVAVKHLTTGEAAYLNAEDYFSAASLYELFVMSAAFQQREAGQLGFQEMIAIPGQAAAQDAAAVSERLGSTPTVAQAIEDMIVVSSNGAGLTLLERLGRPEVNRAVREQGLKDTWLSESGLITTPLDVARLLELIASGQAVSPQASAEMLGTLLRQETNEPLPRYLPTGTRVAHKTGSADFLRHDAGILYTAGGPVVLVAMIEAATDGGVAAESIARLGKLVFQYFESYRPAADKIVTGGNPACPDNPFLAQASGPLSNRTIILDPGHGGTETGATFSFPDGFILEEKEITLDVALRLKESLVKEGATVYMTRCRDVSLASMERAAFANRLKADLFVSISLNGSANPAADGTEALYFSRDGSIVASYLVGFPALPALWNILNSGLPLPDLGVLAQDVDVAVYVLAPSVVTRSVFLTGPSEAAVLRESAGNETSRREQIARGHLRGILNYFAYFASEE